MTTITGHRVEANKPDIVVLDKNTRECLIIDVVCPFDTRVDCKTKEKIEKHQDFKREREVRGFGSVSQDRTSCHRSA